MSLFTINIVPSNDGEVIPSSGGASAVASQLVAARRREILMDLANYLGSVAGGARSPIIDFQVDTAAVTPTYVGAVGAGSVAATGTVTFASSSGTVGCIINGVTVTVTWATSDTASAAALVVAINTSVNALVAGFVTATSALGVTTLTAVNKGKSGNAITLALSGTNVTVSGARLTGGVNATANVL